MAKRTLRSTDVLGRSNEELGRMLVDAGVAAGAGGTCLKQLGLADKLAVGVAGDMPTLVAAVCGSGDIAMIGWRP